MSFSFDDRDTVGHSDNAANYTWDYITRARDAARHGRFQQGLLQECSTWRLKSQTNPTMKELVAEILIINRTIKESRTEQGTAALNYMNHVLSEPGAGRVSPACPAVDFFARVPRDKRLLQAEEKKKNQEKYNLL